MPQPAPRAEAPRGNGAVGGVERTRTRPVYNPPVDIIERERDILVLADMPGVDEKALDITLEKNVLTIQGTVTPAATGGHALAHQEFEPGDYQRAFTLSSEVDREGIQATLRNGVLSLVLPKSGPARTRKIEVKSE